MSVLKLPHTEARTPQSAAATVSVTSGNSNRCRSPIGPGHPD